MQLKATGLFAVAAALIIGAGAASQVKAASFGVTTFANGTAVGATNPDSVTLVGTNVWISYTNNTTGTGGGGNSTVVEYDSAGAVVHQFSIKGSVDGLKYDPQSKLVWAMQNQDGNSTLTEINPVTGLIVKSNIPYAVKSATRGHDDVAFIGTQAFESYTNPVNPTDPVIQLVQNGSDPIVLTPVLRRDAKGTNLVTGMHNQPVPLSDPDSLKTVPSGDLILTSEADGTLIFVSNPGTARQSVSFIPLVDPSGHAVTKLDDALFNTAATGIFYLSDTGNNRVLAIDGDNMTLGTLFASVSSLNAFVSVDTKTGKVTELVRNLNSPHGMELLAKH